jgi:hypothetical protein
VGITLSAQDAEKLRGVGEEIVKEILDLAEEKAE